MLLAHLSPLAASLFSLLAIGSLLLAFVMLGSHWLRNYLLAFTAESWLIALLSGAVGYYGGYPELYVIAVLTALFRGLVLPHLIWRIIIRLEVEREIHVVLQPSSCMVLGALLVLFAFVVSNHLGDALGLGGTIVVLALTVMLSMKLIGFLMLAVRHEAISQVLGLLILENGIFLGSQILVPGMPLLIELVLLFDETPEPSALVQERAWIDAVFSAGSVAEIAQRLDERTEVSASATAATFAELSPTAAHNVGEEVGFLQRPIVWLSGHFLLTCRCQQTKRQNHKPPAIHCGTSDTSRAPASIRNCFVVVRLKRGSAASMHRKK